MANALASGIGAGDTGAIASPLKPQPAGRMRAAQLVILLFAVGVCPSVGTRAGAAQDGAAQDAHTRIVTCVAFSPDGKLLVTGSEDRTVRLWEGVNGKLQKVLQLKNGVNSLAFSPDGKILAVAAGNSVQLWDMPEGKDRATLGPHVGAPVVFAISPDGKLLATGSSKEARVYDLESGALRAALAHPSKNELSSRVTALAFSPDSRTLATGCDQDGLVRLWEAADGRPKTTLEGHRSWVRALAFSRDGRTLASASMDKTIRVWDVAEGKARAILEGHPSAVHLLRFSADEAALASCSQEEARLWDARSGQCKAVLSAQERPLSVLVFSPDGRRVATGSWGDRAACLWNTETGQLEASLQHDLAIYSLAFSPDGAVLAAGCGSIMNRRPGEARLWDVRTRAPRCVLGK